MRKRILMLLFLQCALLIFSGCAAGDFFDVNSTMVPPKASKEEAEIKSVVGNYLGDDFKFCPLFAGERYSSVLRYSFGSAEYIVVFCSSQGEELRSHIILLGKAAGAWVVKDDMVRSKIKLDSAETVKTNSHEFCELILEGTDLETDLPVAFSWRIYSNGTMQIIE